jgi:hypothetical protein
MLAREYCDATKRKLKPIILSHRMMPGLLEVSTPVTLTWCARVCVCGVCVCVCLVGCCSRAAVVTEVRMRARWPHPHS